MRTSIQQSMNVWSGKVTRKKARSNVDRAVYIIQFLVVKRGEKRGKLYVIPINLLIIINYLFTLLRIHKHAMYEVNPYNTKSSATF